MEEPQQEIGDSHDMEYTVDGKIKMANCPVIHIKHEIYDEEPILYENDYFESHITSCDYIICGCGKNFSTEELLKDHLKSNDYNKNCNRRVVKEYQCSLCSKVFSSRQGCAMHVTRIHCDGSSKERRKMEKNNVCEVCGKSYNSAAALRYHMRVHTGERPYSCHLCPKAFTMPLFLQLHIRTHTGERPYKCDHCTKAFSNKAAIMRHQRVHTGEKPYQCPECGKAFSQSNSMKLHLRTVHWKEPAPYKSKARKFKAAMGGKPKETVIVKFEQPKPKSPKPEKPPIVIRIKKEDIIGRITFDKNDEESEGGVLQIQFVPQRMYGEGEPTGEEYTINETDREPAASVDAEQFQYFVEDDVQYQVEIKPEYYEEP